MTINLITANLPGVMEGTLNPDFMLKDLEGSKYQYQDIYYKNQFRVFEKSVRFVTFYCRYLTVSWSV